MHAQRLATRGEQLGAPDAWSASLARNPESTTLLSSCATCSFIMSCILKVTLKKKEIISAWQPFSSPFCEQRLPKQMEIFFCLVPVVLGCPCSLEDMGAMPEGSHTWSYVVTSMQSLNSATFLCWDCLPLRARSYQVLRAPAGFWEGELLSAKHPWPPPQPIPK